MSRFQHNKKPFKKESSARARGLCSRLMAELLIHPFLGAGAEISQLCGGHQDSGTDLFCFPGNQTWICTIRHTTVHKIRIDTVFLFDVNGLGFHVKTSCVMYRYWTSLRLSTICT